MKPMRVAIVVSHPIQHFCPQYSSWSKLENVDLKVFFASRHGLDAYEDKNFARTVIWENIVLDFPHEFMPGAASRAVSAQIDCDGLDQALSEYSPDVVVVYGYSQPLQLRATKWANRNGKPAIMVADSELRARRSLVKRLLKALIVPRLLRKASVFMTVGDANESYYRAYGVDDRRMVRSFFPIDVCAFDDLSGRASRIRRDLRGELGIPEDHAVLLMVGKLVPWKRQQDLVTVSNTIQTSARRVTVILAGTGPDEGRLRRMAKKPGAGGVLFAGFVSPKKLVEYYFAADIYVHCSEMEPHSLAISEAIYAGLPVVVSDRCGSYGPTDDVRPGLNGFAYRCGDVNALHAALVSILDSPGMKEAMGRSSKEIAAANQSLAHGKALTQALCIVRSGGVS